MSRLSSTRTHGVPLAAVVFAVAAFGTAGPIATIMGRSDRIQASEVVLSNLTGPQNNVFGAQPGVTLTTAFTTAASPTGWFLESVKFPVRRDTAGTGFQVSVFNSSTSAPVPGSVVGSFSGSDNPTTGMQTYTAPGSGISLLSSTTYWMVWEAVTGDYGITLTSNTATTGTWTIPTGGAYGVTYDSGANWYIDNNNQGFKVELTASPQPAAVPEIDPAGLGSVLALVIGGLGVLERRRLKTA